MVQPKMAGPTLTLPMDPSHRASEGHEDVSVLIYHASGREIVGLAPGESLILGRAEPSDIVLDDPGLSRCHLKLERRGSEVFAEDLGSTNGSRLNDVSIERSAIAPGDVVRVGAAHLTVHVLSPLVIGRLEAHDAFRARIEDERTRARCFQRPFCLVLARGPTIAGAWFGDLQGDLRDVDRAAAYSEDVVEILLPERTASEAVSMIERFESPDALSYGLAAFPEAGTSVGALYDAAAAALARCTPEEPIQRAPARGTQTLDASPEAPVVGESMRSFYETVDTIARSVIPVLILGETGSGKEVVVRTIHQRSARAKAPMCAVNCAALPSQLVESTLFGHEKGAFTGATERKAGVFESADGGTVFLDEIGDLPLDAQASLLRTLEAKCITRVGATRERVIDVRIVAATHRNLEEMCEAGAFRWDLLYRLNTMVLEVPPLRARLDEVPALAEHFVRQANEVHGASARGLDDDAIQTLTSYGWPGNIRELKNAIERAAVLAHGKKIRSVDLPPRMRGTRAVTTRSTSPGLTAGNFKDLVQQYEIGLITGALQAAGGNKAEAARRLEMPYRTLAYKVRAYDIKT